MPRFGKLPMGDERRVHLTELVGAVSASLASLGVLIYAYAWTAHRGFYAQFDLTPSDVGLKYADVLTQAATASVLLGAATGFLATAFAAARSWLPRHERLASLGILAIATVLTAVLLLSGGPQTRLLLLTWLILCCTTAPMVLARARSSFAAAVAFASAVVGLGFVLVYGTGAGAAKDLILNGQLAVKAEKELPGLTREQVGFVDWNPISVTLQTSEGASLVRPDTKSASRGEAGFYLLGSTDGTLVLWDVCERRVTLLPSGSVVVTFRGEPDAITEADDGQIHSSSGGSSCGGGAGR